MEIPESLKKFPPDLSQGWKPWEFEPNHLVMRQNGHDIYDIPLRNFETAANCMKWLSIVRDKTWATPEVMAGLANAMVDFCEEVPDR